MKKSFLRVLICFIIVVSIFTACSQKTDKYDNIHSRQIKLLGSRDDDFWKVNAEFIDVSIKEESNSNAIAFKTVVLPNGESVEVNYKNTTQSVFRNIEKYENSSRNVSCGFDADSGKLFQIQFGITKADPIDSSFNESEYKIWIEKILNFYGYISLSDYEYSCQTDIIVSEIDHVYKENYDYFCFGKNENNEIVSARTFSYTRTVNNYKTSDKISVTINTINETVMIKFDLKDFTDRDVAAIEQSEIVPIVEAFILSSYNDAKYVANKIEVRDKRLMIIDGTLAIVVETEIEFSQINVEELYTELVSVAIEL